MATLERILYPSNRFAAGVYLVVLSILAILFIYTNRAPIILYIGAGFILGWTAHVLYSRHYAQTHGRVCPKEFETLQQSLAAAKEQLDRAKAY